MTAKEKITKIINGRITCIIARGNSLVELEQKIDMLKNYDICWASLNLFSPAEFILNKINKRLEILSDCTNHTLRDSFEPKVRRPRLEEYLKRSDSNLLQISNTVIADLQATNQYDLHEKYRDKIITIDEIFSEPTCPKSVWDAPPNSITLLIASIVAGQAKKIIVFGLDGYRGENALSINTYYKSELEAEDRIKAAGKVNAGSLGPDSSDFERRFRNIYTVYQKSYNNYCEIVNCSPKSIFSCIRKINYSQLEEEII